MADSCAVCYLPFGSGALVKAPCPFCGFPVCQGCQRRFALGIVSTAHCMQCKRAFSREDLVRLLGVTFVAKTYTQHRKDQLLSLERSLLPAAQATLEQMLGPDSAESTDVVEQRVAEEQAKRELLNRELEPLRAAKRAKREEIRNSQQTTNTLLGVLKRRRNGFKIKELQEERGHLVRTAAGGPEVHKHFVQKCPVGGCRGFLSVAWKCGICGASICHLCGAEKKAEQPQPSAEAGETLGEDLGPMPKPKAEHTCKKEDAETWAVLRASTKNCPSCGTAIFKVDGCDQMWCTNCHTAFSWKTLTVLENQHVHNPHYFQWRQEHPDAPVRDAGDVGCGGIPEIHTAGAFVRGRANHKFLADFAQRLNHHHAVTLPRLGLPTDAKQQVLRLRFLNKELDEVGWMREAMKLAKGAEYADRVAQVYNMLLNVGSDLLRNLNAQAQAAQKEGTLKTIEEMNSLVAYADGQFALLGKAYQLKEHVVGVESLEKRREAELAKKESPHATVRVSVQ